MTTTNRLTGAWRGLLLVACCFQLSPWTSTCVTAGELCGAVAEREITPPPNYPMAGYYHERLAQGTLDPLKARAMVLRQDDVSVAIVFCDLTGIATDLTMEVRQAVEQRTNIPAAHVILSATHSHTAPDYYRDLYLYLDDNPDRPSTEYPRYLIEQIVAAVVQADNAVEEIELLAGRQLQATPVAFNRRFVMRDGSVKTWQKLSNPEVVKAAGPIDPEIGICAIRSRRSTQSLGVFSNFALHLDTVGGRHWSADYPFYIEQAIRSDLGESVVSLFGLGCCGDINHVDPSQAERNKTDFIGNSLGASITSGLKSLTPIEDPVLGVQSSTVLLPLRSTTTERVARSHELMVAAKEGTDVEFFELVTAYKTVILDQFHTTEARTINNPAVSWGLSHRLAGCGPQLPVDVCTVTVGDRLALVFLPGEIFVDLGLAIKQASPFPQTFVIELSNAVETAYIPTQAAFAGGSYEVTNSTVQAGSGEMLVEAALRQLGLAASKTARPTDD